MKTLNLLKNTFKRWDSIEPFRHSAVIAYYSVFSLPAFVVILTNITGLIYSNDSFRQKMNTFIQDSIGPGAAQQIQTMYEQTEMGESWTGIITGIATLLFGVTGMFYHLQKSFNKIWEVDETKKQGFMQMLFRRFISLLVVFSIAVLILSFLIFQAILKTINTWLEQEFNELIVTLFELANLFVPLIVLSFLFAILFKMLPQTKTKWKSVLFGGLVTAILFQIGNFAVGLYFENFDPASSYGVSSSLVLILLWMNYIGLIMLLGGAFTKQISIKI